MLHEYYCANQFVSSAFSRIKRNTFYIYILYRKKIFIYISFLLIYFKLFYLILYRSFVLLPNYIKANHIRTKIYSYFTNYLMLFRFELYNFFGQQKINRKLI